MTTAREFLEHVQAITQRALDTGDFNEHSFAVLVSCASSAFVETERIRHSLIDFRREIERTDPSAA